jgi:hypothetical protein
VTLRDWFAGQALSGFTKHCHNEISIEKIVTDSYAVADLMITRREADNKKEAEKA